MRRLVDSFFGKVALLFLAVILVIGAGLAWCSLQSLPTLISESDQRLNRSLAAELAPTFQAVVRDSSAQRRPSRPRLATRHRVFVLNADGRVVAHFPADLTVRDDSVDLAPVHSFMEGRPLPIWGDNPVHPPQPSTFSAAAFEYEGRPAYLYVVLGSPSVDSPLGLVQESSTVQDLLGELGLVLLFATLIGLLLLAHLTRRIRSMRQSVVAFANGDLNRRIDTTAAGEIGQLAASFNQMAETIAHNVQELEQAAQMRRELVANISHDLRSPLTVLSGHLETILIKSDRMSSSELVSKVERALRNVKRLSRLVDDLFELSKLDAQQVEAQEESFSLPELLYDVALQYEGEAETSSIQLELEVATDLQPVVADIALVERALTNLLDNAFRYTPADGSVRLRLSGRGDRAEVTVQDTGKGIPPEDLPHIFDRFYRVEKSRDRKHGGSGLGLAITQKILELQGSRLEVESTIGEGTAFRFHLPFARGGRSAPGGSVSDT